MVLRKYQASDLTAMAELFYHTVHTVNARDYTPEQLNAWAPGQVDKENWHRRFSASCTLTAVQDDEIVGFGNIDETGYFDMLYVHAAYQRRGIATALCDALEKAFPLKKITVHASITAKPFFMKRGYRIIKEQQVICRGVEMTNYVMEKI